MDSSTSSRSNDLFRAVGDKNVHRLLIFYKYIDNVKLNNVVIFVLPVQVFTLLQKTSPHQWSIHMSEQMSSVEVVLKYCS